MRRSHRLGACAAALTSFALVSCAVSDVETESLDSSLGDSVKSSVEQRRIALINASEDVRDTDAQVILSDGVVLEDEYTRAVVDLRACVEQMGQGVDTEWSYGVARFSAVGESADEAFRSCAEKGFDMVEAGYLATFQDPQGLGDRVVWDCIHRNEPGLVGPGDEFSEERLGPLLEKLDHKGLTALAEGCSIDPQQRNW
jgi:hypothetical protein